MKNILVIGAGRFGTYLTQKFAEQGDEILVIDSREERLDKVLPFVTSSLIGCDGRRLHEIHRSQFFRPLCCIHRR